MRARVAAVGVAAAVAGAAGTRAGAAAARGLLPTGDRIRTNFRGREVDLAEGIGASVGAAAGALVAGSPRRALLVAGVGALGLVDDIVEPRRLAAGERAPKGLAGHLGALRAGRPSTGTLKLLGIPLLAVAARALAPDRGAAAPRLPAAVLDGGVVAGCANLVNLLDLRPGRALKATALLGAAALPGAAPALGAAAASLPADLGERGMLGDAGANALGAAVGDALTDRLPPAGRLAALVVLAALTVASERVSFSAVIARTPALAALDALGRDGGDR
jgi:hypothetical protein